MSDSSPFPYLIAGGVAAYLFYLATRPTAPRSKWKPGRFSTEMLPIKDEPLSPEIVKFFQEHPDAKAEEDDIDRSIMEGRLAHDGVINGSQYW